VRNVRNMRDTRSGRGRTGRIDMRILRDKTIQPFLGRVTTMKMLLGDPHQEVV